MIGKKIFFISMVIAAVFAYTAHAVVISPGEKISYAISPMGTAVYSDMGIVDYKGKELWLVTFKTRLPGFNDLEKIYADPNTGLPLIVERYIRWPMSEEFLIEEYDPENNAQVTRRFVKNKMTNEYKYKSDGPYHNAILLPFYLRGIKNPQIGWKMVVRVPEEFTVILSEIKDIKTQGKTIKAYHFTSNPNKFDIWISKDEYLLPIVSKGSGYGLTLKSHIPGKNIASSH